MNVWPFDDPSETEVIVLGRILREESPLRLVAHDEDDGAWQFLDGEQVFEDDAAIVALGEMVQLDPSLRELAGLPRGWFAWRDDPARPWRREPGEPPVTA